LNLAENNISQCWKGVCGGDEGGQVLVGCLVEAPELEACLRRGGGVVSSLDSGHPGGVVVEGQTLDLCVDVGAVEVLGRDVVLVDDVEVEEEFVVGGREELEVARGAVGDQAVELWEEVEACWVEGLGLLQLGAEFGAEEATESLQDVQVRADQVNG